MQAENSTSSIARFDPIRILVQYLEDETRVTKITALFEQDQRVIILLVRHFDFSFVDKIDRG